MYLLEGLRLTALRGMIQIGELSVKVSEGAAELFTVARIGGGIQIILNASAGEKKRIPLTGFFELLRRKRGSLFAGGL
jgi:hypothetical protein